MSEKLPKLHDGFVTDADFIHVQAAIARHEFQNLVYELTTREPEIAIGLSERFSDMLTLLEGVSMSITQHATIQRHLTLLTWTPLLALARANRRAWEGFLPSTEVVDETKDGAE